MAHSVCESNTVGRGYAEHWYLKARRLRKIPAPQIESPEDPIRLFQKAYSPEGFGVISKTSKSRLQLAGTYNAQWIKDRHPYLPKDFDASYWNGAHPDLQLSWLKGEEQVDLTNLTPEGLLTFQLPGHLPYALIYHEEGPIIPKPMHLDTLFIEPDARTCSLVWRVAIPFAPKVTEIESRMVLSEERAAQESLGILMEILRG